jgi:hypothetical protein
MRPYRSGEQHSHDTKLPPRTEHRLYLWLGRTSWSKHVSLLIKLGFYIMLKEEDKKYYEDHMKHWRAWGSWFSWGSPVGLGLFFMATGFTIWILGQTFHW